MLLFRAFFNNNLPFRADFLRSSLGRASAPVFVAVALALAGLACSFALFVPLVVGPALLPVAVAGSSPPLVVLPERIDGGRRAAPRGEVLDSRAATPSADFRAAFDTRGDRLSSGFWG